MSEQTKTWNKYIHKVQNYETDQMGIVHHSNYIRWFEEARCDLLDYMGVGFADLEKQGIISPILSVEADYLRMVYYGDTVSIDAYIKEYNGIKLIVGYEVKDDRTGMVHCRGTSKHCFIDKTGRPLVLRKSFPELNEAFEAGVKVHKENKKALINEIADKNKPQKQVLKHTASAFLVGGVIGMIGEFFLNLYKELFSFSEKEATPIMLITLILIAAILTGLGIYDRLGDFAGAGSFIPITGFSNAMTSSAMEARSEGFVTGIGANIFKLGGAVITFGIVASFVLGGIRYVITYFW